MTLTGNLFYGNTAGANRYPVVRYGGIVTSNGYNVVDVAGSGGGGEVSESKMFQNGDKKSASLRGVDE